MKAILALEDGTIFEGESFGAQGECTGEVVFNTSMAGYQEVLTDPSYKGQIVVMTYPLVGNYRVNDEDFESPRIWVEGFVVKEYSEYPSSWRTKTNLSEFLKNYGTIGIKNIDTRTLVRHIRDKGSMKGIISSRGLINQTPTSIKKLVKKAQDSPGLVGRDLVKEVQFSPPTVWGNITPEAPYIVVYDFGVKHNILRSLSSLGCKLQVVRADTPFSEPVIDKADGVLLSNGPGDPEAVEYAIENIKKLIRTYTASKPIFGICLGHQLLSLALGARTFKLKFGHHGGNHPVKNLETERIEITVQNHCFAVDPDSLRDVRCVITHINLNDGTVEGMKHSEYPIFSVQYHPEASPGPHDAGYEFKKFIELCRKEEI